jgi:hypothetical protein
MFLLAAVLAAANVGLTVSTTSFDMGPGEPAASASPMSTMDGTSGVDGVDSVRSAATSSFGTLSWVLIGSGVLLLLFGTGLIVLPILRNRRAGVEEYR